jgi:hypothetical protein
MRSKLYPYLAAANVRGVKGPVIQNQGPLTFAGFSYNSR